MEPTEVLRAAHKAVTDAGLPEHLQVIGFTEAVRLIAGPRTPAATGSGATASAKTAAKAAGGNARRPTRQSTPSAPSEVGPVIDPAGAFRLIASETGVDEISLESLFHVEGGTTPQVVVRVSQLGTTVAERQKNMTLLLTVFRYHAIGESETPMSVIRDEAKRLRIFDTNINKRAEAVPSLSYVGPADAKRVKPKPSADPAFAELVRKLTGATEDS